MLVKHCRIINKPDTVKPLVKAPVQARETKRTMLYELHRYYFFLVITHLSGPRKRETRRSAIHSPRGWDSSPNRVQVRHDFGVCAKLARYTRVSLISFSRTKLSPWRETMENRWRVKRKPLKWQMTGYILNTPLQRGAALFSSFLFAYISHIQLTRPQHVYVYWSIFNNCLFLIL